MKAHDRCVTCSVFTNTIIHVQWCVMTEKNCTFGAVPDEIVEISSVRVVNHKLIF